MSVSKGNELLQELYEKLTGHWYKKGKYAGQSCSVSDVKVLVGKINEEYKEKEDERTVDSEETSRY